MFDSVVGFGGAIVFGLFDVLLSFMSSTFILLLIGGSGSGGGRRGGRGHRGGRRVIGFVVRGRILARDRSSASSVILELVQRGSGGRQHAVHQRRPVLLGVQRLQLLDLAVHDPSIPVPNRIRVNIVDKKSKFWDFFAQKKLIFKR